MCDSPYDAANRADAVVLVTEWPEYQTLDPAVLAKVMRGRLVVDGRNALDRDELESSGLVHAAFGRPLRWITLTEIEPLLDVPADRREPVTATPGLG
jgi:hypothetical protein